MLSVDLPDGRDRRSRRARRSSDSTTPADPDPGADARPQLDRRHADARARRRTPCQLGESRAAARPPLGHLPQRPRRRLDQPRPRPTLPLAVSDVSVPGQVLRGVGFTRRHLHRPVGHHAADRRSRDRAERRSTRPSRRARSSRRSCGRSTTSAASTAAAARATRADADAGAVRVRRARLADRHPAHASRASACACSTATTRRPTAPTRPRSPRRRRSPRSPRPRVGRHRDLPGPRRTAIPSAGIQQVWVTYTGVDQPADGTGEWESLYLTQDATDSTLWTGTLTGLSADADRRPAVRRAGGQRRRRGQPGRQPGQLLPARPDRRRGCRRGSPAHADDAARSTRRRPAAPTARRFRSAPR